MEETDPAIAGTRTAIQLLRLWLEQNRLTAAHIQGVLNDPNGPGAAHIIAGQLDLGMLLLLTLAKERGAGVDDLEETARTILQDLSAGLSE